MSNAYIPDQLHHMSKKELLEFAQTAHEENVKLVQQLAKVNERVKELEKNSKDRFIQFAKSNKAVDGKSSLFIHALGVAFDKEQLRKGQE